MLKDWNEIVNGCVQDIGTAKNVATISCIPAIFSNIISVLLMFIGITALVLFVVAGFKFMWSAGDPKKLEGARNNLVYGVLGLLIVLLSFGIMNIVSYVTGVPCITKFGFGCD